MTHRSIPVKSFTGLAAQGDMLIRRIDKLPEGLEEIAPEDGKHILTHSETGHHHVVLERPGIKHFKAMNELRSYLVVPEDTELEVVHLRDSHTHGTLKSTGGIFEIIRQREHDPKAGWRRAVD